MKLVLTTIETCGICERRPADCSVVIEGAIVPICSTCYERAEDETNGR